MNKEICNRSLKCREVDSTQITDFVRERCSYISLKSLSLLKNPSEFGVSPGDLENAQFPKLFVTVLIEGLPDEAVGKTLPLIQLCHNAVCSLNSNILVGFCCNLQQQINEGIIDFVGPNIPKETAAS